MMQTDGSHLTGMVDERGLSIIENKEVLGKPMLIYGTAEDPLFLATDVANWIGHTNVTRMLNGIDPDEKKFSKQSLGNSGNPNKWFLTEEGVYEVLMRSRKPIAKQFKKQVKHILITIRKTGGYISITPKMTDKEILSQALMIAQKTLEQQDARLLEQDRMLEEQSRQLETQKPVVDYANQVLNASNLHTVNSIATHLRMSAVRLNKFLESVGWIYKQGRTWYPTEKIRDKGYCDFHVVPYAFDDTGKVKTREHLKWTEKGRKAVIDLWHVKMSSGAKTKTEKQPQLL